ncbi:ParB/RepB/Spo0J family partition protein [Bacillus sp. JJ722]|uniref:ParB/RepB/Spo0J family partition protein n=1 Tax=Bacillus sp. JJ722 TaxID=3122973 RepID=UPI002FFFAABC
MEVTKLEISKIITNPNQPRKHFDEERLQELADSIESDGLKSPILVRPAGDCYEIVQGERRFRASKLAGLDTISAFIEELTEEDAFHLAVIENIQREQLTPMEEAQAFKKYVELGYTHEAIGKKVSKSRTYVTSRLRLLKLIPEIQDMLATGKLAEGHAKQILKLRNDLPGETENEKPFEYAQFLFINDFKDVDKISVNDVKHWADKVLRGMLISILRVFKEYQEENPVSLDVCRELNISITDITENHLEFLTDSEIRELPKGAKKSEIYAKFENIEAQIFEYPGDLSELWAQKLLKASEIIIKQNLQKIDEAQIGLAKAYDDAAEMEKGEASRALIDQANKIRNMDSTEFFDYIVSRDTFGKIK